MALKRSINVNKRINTLTTRILKQDPGKTEEGDLPGEGRKEVTRAVQDWREHRAAHREEHASPGLAQKIQKCSGRYLYLSTHKNLTISFTPPSSQVKIVMEPNVQ